MKKNLVIFGAGGHANSCIDVIKELNKFNILGHLNNSKINLHNFRIIGQDKDLSNIFKKCKNYFIGIGQIKNWKVRYKIYKKLKKINANLPTIISNNSIVSKNSKIGEGTIIMNGCIKYV